jgi:hypothetical protein
VVVGALIALLMLVNIAAAESRYDAIPHGPKIGAAAGPLLDDAIDQDGQPQNLPSLSGKKGLILLFSRSFDW